MMTTTTSTTRDYEASSLTQVGRALALAPSRDNADGGISTVLEERRRSQSLSHGRKLEEGASTLGALGEIPEEEFEEEGVRAWLNVAGAFLILAVTFGYVSAYGVFQSWYQTHQFVNLSPSAIAWIGSTGIALEYMSGAIGGNLFDKGWYYLPLRIGCIVFVLCLFMISLCKQYWQFFLAQGVGVGFSIGFACLPSLCVIPQYFHRRKSMAMGIAMSGTSLGAALFPVLLNSTFVKLGFRQGVRIAGYVCLGCLILANCMMKTKYKVRREGQRKHKRTSVIQLLLEPKYVIAIMSGFLLTIGMFFPVYYIQTFYKDLKLPDNITLYSLSILNAGSFFGRIVPNIFSDRVGPMNVLTFCSLMGGCVTFGMFGISSPAGAILFTVVLGFFSGSYVSVLSPVFLSLSKDPSEDGIRQGLGFLFCGVGALLGPPASGALLSAGGGDFKYAIVFSACITFAGSAGIAWTRFLLSRSKKTWKV